MAVGELWVARHGPLQPAHARCRPRGWQASSPRSTSGCASTDLHRRRELLQRLQGIALEIVGPRSSEATVEMLTHLRPTNAIPVSNVGVPAFARARVGARASNGFLAAAGGAGRVPGPGRSPPRED